MSHTKLRWVSNIYNPNKSDAVSRATKRVGQSPTEAFRQQQEWLAGKYLGDPQGTEHYTAEQLAKMGMKGVYVLEEVNDAAN